MAKVFVLLLVKIILCFGFSKNALVTLRNGSLYLICRIADLRCFVCDDDDDDDDDGDDDGHDGGEIINNQNLLLCCNCRFSLFVIFF